MALGNCPDEITDCDLDRLGTEQIFRKLLRKVGNCLSLSVNAVISGTFSPSSTSRTVTRVSNGVGSYNTTAGARSVTIETDSAFTGTIAGVAASPDRAYDFRVQQNDDSLASFAFVVTTGTVIITELN